MSGICRVITGVSGSPRSLPALRYAAALAHDHSATLIPVLAWLPPGSELAYCKCPSGTLRPVWEQDARERLEAALAAAYGGIPAEVTTETLVARGEAGQVLVHTASWPGDLLVIGTGRQGSLGRWMGGAVSRYCLAHAVGPVLAVPPSTLESHSRRSLSGLVFWHRGLQELTTAASSPSSRQA